MNTIQDYQKTVHQSVDHLFENIDQLKKKGQFVKEEQKHFFQQKIADLEDKREVLRKKYNELSASSGKASIEMKSGFEKAKLDLTRAWNEAKEKFVS